MCLIQYIARVKYFRAFNVDAAMLERKCETAVTELQNCSKNMTCRKHKHGNAQPLKDEMNQLHVNKNLQICKD